MSHEYERGIMPKNILITGNKYGRRDKRKAEKEDDG